MNKKRNESFLVFIIQTLAWMAFVLSFSVAVPLLWRGFYYMHIKSLSLVSISDHSYAQIKDAYDHVMDYCIFGKEFSTGVMKSSQSGMDHFADCAVLFRFDLLVLITSTAILVIFHFIQKKHPPVRFGLTDQIGHGPKYCAGLVTIVFFITITYLVSLDFDEAFLIFHTIFFPGEDNWNFNPYTDEIILVLPQEYFMHCAILIVAILFLICIILILTDKKGVYRKR